MARADKKHQIEVDALTRIKEALEAGKLASSVALNDEEQEQLSDLYLLTAKPMMYVGNLSEEQLKNVDNDKHFNELKEYALKNNSEAIPLCVKIEEELATLEDDERNEMLELMGIDESGLDKLIKASYKLLGLMSFLTAGEPEVRAWTIKIGTKAPAAAGKIHSDIERGFIKAEVISYKDLMECGSIAKAKEKGLVRFEGKEYVMQDGDVVLFRFNV